MQINNLRVDMEIDGRVVKSAHDNDEHIGVRKIDRLLERSKKVLIATHLIELSDSAETAGLKQLTVFILPGLSKYFRERHFK